LNVYVCFVTDPKRQQVSTIGYGNYAPQTAGGRAFVAGTVIFGVAFFGYVLTLVSERLLCLISYVARKIKRKPRGFKLASNRVLPVAVFLNLVFLFVLALPTILFENWKFQDAMYYSVITITTVGFGDLVPNFQNYSYPTSALVMALYAFLVLIAMALLSAVIASLQQHLAEYQHKITATAMSITRKSSLKGKVRTKAKAAGQIKLAMKSSRVSDASPKSKAAQAFTAAGVNVAQT
jgi:hypothetical protein